MIKKYYKNTYECISIYFYSFNIISDNIFIKFKKKEKNINI